MRRPSKKCNEKLMYMKKNCRNRAIEMLTTKDVKLFDLIDPLLSDNQCQVHSLLLLNTLMKCYRYDDCSYDITRLDDIDIENLSDAIFLTSIKIEHVDGFGMVVRQESLEHFGGNVDSKKTESKFIAQIKQNFNWNSVDFIRTIAKKSVKQILDDCAASIPHSKIKLKVLPFYGSVYALLSYIKMKRVPILIALKRIEIKDLPTEIIYKVNGVDMYYYKWNGMKFQFFEHLNECELNEPCMTIGHLIMASLATHFQLSESKDLKLNPGYGTSDNYIKSIYKQFSIKSTKQHYSVDSQFDGDCVNVYEQYMAHRRLAMDFNCESSQYAKFHKSVSTRRIHNAFFGVRHAHVSNYLNEHAKRLALNVEVELGQYHFLPDINMDAVRLDKVKKINSL